MKSQFDKKQIEDLKKSNRNFDQVQKKNFKSRHKIEQYHLYLKNDVQDQTPILKSRRKK